MSLLEKTLSSQLVYRGKVLNLRLDTVLLPNGCTGMREVVEYAGAVAVVALGGNGGVYLVRQYRYPVKRELLEIPAGKIEPAEEPLACARRELSEETGLVAARWQQLCSFYSTPGFTNEEMHLFLARDLEQAAQHPDPDEFVQVVEVPLPEALAMISRGEICDAKSVAGLLLAARFLSREEGGQDYPSTG
ncbi:NUDIX domain-containing protein [Desulfotomaculum copahuensis]|uniref:ADP-ribose pyrophosphatase n=1 Tax=Desulfotomaculum copahuensis TaxID=1838280 RepID=A0A1B7LEM5_9FIRM|nr:NUDIX hydrolase [Desulfotomaculum copahuensis]OAT81741.1 ADP-ribose pyrophosphatase [Desulfotomaculum copahuensis]